MRACFSSLSAAAITLLFGLIALPAVAQDDPSVPSLSADQVNRLTAGEILVEVVPGELPVGDAIGVIAAPPDQVMAVIRDFNRHEEILDDIAESEIIGQDGEYTLQRGVTDTPWPMEDRRWTLRSWAGPIEVDGMPCLISRWTYVPDSGNIVDTYGYWLLVPWGAEGTDTLLRYHITVDLGTWLPDFLLEWSTENMLPGRIQALRAQFSANL